MINVNIIVCVARIAVSCCGMAGLAVEQPGYNEVGRGEEP